MENNRLGTHHDKMCAEILTINTTNTPLFIRPIHQNWPIIWDILGKSPHHMSIVHTLKYVLKKKKYQFMEVLNDF